MQHKPIFLFFIFLFMPLSVFCSNLVLEIADSPQKRAEGLMNRHFLPEDRGMYFIYPEMHYATFWMLNCYIDLSVAFIDENHTILEIYNLKAHPEWIGRQDAINLFSQASVTSKKPMKYALEVNSGWFERNNIHIGNKFFPYRQ